MNKNFYPRLNETVYKEVLPNGLTVVVVPRPGFTKKLAYFATDFGSIHTEFTLDGKTHRVPDGIAHYLEHKMFDLPGRDVTAEFAALGAVPNAFTSYDMTAYYFSCTQNFEKSLELLLEFVSTAYFTEETVQKEQGIIGQEIGMHEDDPDSRSFELMMDAMYEHHPVRVPILGTRESIAQITPELLHLCHRAFYCPANMLLCVTGDVDPEQVSQIARKMLPQQAETPAKAVRSWDETMQCGTHYLETQMEVAMPMFQLGFKYEPQDRGAQAIQTEMVGDLAAEALFGESSPLFLRLYQEGLIDSSFGGGFETIEGMAMLTASGDTMQSEAVRDAIVEEARRIAEEGIEEADFLRMKRSALGRRIRALDSFDSVCFRVCAYHFSGYDYFRFPELYEGITVSHIQQFLKQAVTPERMCLCVVNPKTQEVM